MNSFIQNFKEDFINELGQKREFNPISSFSNNNNKNIIYQSRNEFYFEKLYKF